MTKPIEPGCLVMVVRMSCEIHKSLLGKVGVVISSVPSDLETEVGGVLWASSTDGPFWEVKFPEDYTFDQDGKYITAKSVPIYHQNLIRVDGDVDEESQCDEVSKIKPISININV